MRSLFLFALYSFLKSLPLYVRRVRVTVVGSGRGPVRAPTAEPPPATQLATGRPKLQALPNCTVSSSGSGQRSTRPTPRCQDTRSNSKLQS